MNTRPLGYKAICPAPSQRLSSISAQGSSTTTLNARDASVSLPCCSLWDPAQLRLPRGWKAPLSGALPCDGTVPLIKLVLANQPAPRNSNRGSGENESLQLSSRRVTGPRISAYGHLLDVRTKHAHQDRDRSTSASKASVCSCTLASFWTLV